jgi:hypothetical protein
MRAREFTIDLAIDEYGNIEIKPIMSDNNNALSMPDAESSCPEEEESVMVPPLQQTIELQKASVGKHSDVIDDLVSDEDSHEKDSEVNDEIDDSFLSFWNDTLP